MKFEGIIVKGIAASSKVLFFLFVCFKFQLRLSVYFVIVDYQNKNESNLNLSNQKNSIKKGKNVSAPVPTTVSSLAIEEKSIGTGGGRKSD